MCFGLLFRLLRDGGLFFLFFSYGSCLCGYFFFPPFRIYFHPVEASATSATFHFFFKFSFCWRLLSLLLRAFSCLTLPFLTPWNDRSRLQAKTCSFTLGSPPNYHLSPRLYECYVCRFEVLLFPSVRTHGWVIPSNFFSFPLCDFSFSSPILLHNCGMITLPS